MLKLNNLLHIVKLQVRSWVQVKVLVKVQVKVQVKVKDQVKVQVNVHKQVKLNIEDSMSETQKGRTWKDTIIKCPTTTTTTHQLLKAHISASSG